MDSWLKENLVCPRDHRELESEGESLICPGGHRYASIDQIPILLIEEIEPTHPSCTESIEQAAGKRHTSFEAPEVSGNSPIDPFVQQAIGATCGYMYLPLVNRIQRYPIPELRLPYGSGERLLDIGCNWGRWSISAAQRGYSVVGIDPSLEAIRAARRVASKLDLPMTYLVADARHLPFKEQSLDLVFSYSVLQHFSREHVLMTLSEMARILRPGGTSLVQMLNAYGIRCLYHQIMRGFKEVEGFEVRYWRPGELNRVFSETIGLTTFSVDGFFSANAQLKDIDLLKLRHKLIVYSSEFFRSLSRWLPGVSAFADSLYIKSVRSEADPHSLNR